jgi:hypothetical protein
LRAQTTFFAGETMIARLLLRERPPWDPRQLQHPLRDAGFGLGYVFARRLL